MEQLPGKPSCLETNEKIVTPFPQRKYRLSLCILTTIWIYKGGEAMMKRKTYLEVSVVDQRIGTEERIITTNDKSCLSKDNIEQIVEEIENYSH
eukprot:bmy_00283T0